MQGYFIALVVIGSRELTGRIINAVIFLTMCRKYSEMQKLVTDRNG